MAPTTPQPRPRAVGSAGSPQQTGQRGEELAARYLSDLGWTVLDRNWRPSPPRRGELDIVALQPPRAAAAEPARPLPGDGSPIGPGVPALPGAGARLVAVEVKTRTGLRLGPPAAAVDSRKLARLRRLAAAWAAAHVADHDALRIDVISIVLRRHRPALLRHHQGVGV